MCQNFISLGKAAGHGETEGKQWGTEKEHGKSSAHGSSKWSARVLIVNVWVLLLCWDVNWSGNWYLGSCKYRELMNCNGLSPSVRLQMMQCWALTGKAWLERRSDVLSWNAILLSSPRPPPPSSSSLSLFLRNCHWFWNHLIFVGLECFSWCHKLRLAKPLRASL